MDAWTSVRVFISRHTVLRHREEDICNTLAVTAASDMALYVYT